MSHVISDSDEEEMIEGEADADMAESIPPHKPEQPPRTVNQEGPGSQHGERDAESGCQDRTQSTGSTEKMLREAHNAIAQPTPLPAPKRKLDASILPPDLDETSLIYTVSTEARSRENKRAKLQQTKTSASPEKSEEHVSKRNRRSRTTDDWDVPPSSSPILPSTRWTEKVNGEHASFKVTVEPPQLQERTDGTESTIMNTSSDERRARELAEELHRERLRRDQQASSRSSTQLSEPHSEIQRSRTRALSTQETHISVEAATKPQQQSDTIMVLADTTTKQSSKKAKTQSAALRTPTARKEPSSNPMAAKDAFSCTGNEFNQSDEIAIGLPKESYKPRPSRSRSSRLPEPAVEAPAPTQGKKRKRATTTGNLDEDLIVVQTLGTADKDNSASQEVLGGSNGNARKTKAGLGKSDEKRRPTKAIKTSCEEQIEHSPGEAKIDGFVDKTEGDIIRVTSKETQSSNRKENSSQPGPVTQNLRKSRKVVADDEGEEVDDIDELSADRSNPTRQHATVDEPKKEAKDVEAGNKKKGRGRPKKAQSHPPATSDETSKADSAAPAPLEPRLEIVKQPKLLSHGEVEKASALEQQTDPEKNTGDTLGDVATPSPQESVLEKKAGDTNPTKRSPLNRNSAPLRVGLSRRMRIEPLLKMKGR